MIERTRKSRGPLIAHSVLGILGISICVLLASYKGGHPPMLIFLPLVVAVWAVGHVAIWGAGRIAARGRRIDFEAGKGARAWPPGLIVVLALTGFACAIGLVQLVVSALMRELYPFRLPVLWTLTMAVWVVHGACFVGVLLRKRWSRYLCAALPMGWAALMAVQIVDHLAHRRPVDPVEMTIAVGLVLIPLALAYHLIMSKRIARMLDN